MAVYRCTHCGAMNRVPKARLHKRPICGRCKEILDVSGAPQPVSTADLARVIEASPVPVLVDFWAEWCGPCRMAAPVLDRIARRRAGELLVLKVDSDANPDAASRHGIQGIPAFIVFRNGSEAARRVGLLPEGQFQRWVDGELAA
ncbi:MAG TPA: thioredoxin TrxC [Polyangiaceae bacterium]|nr:thioredoxin TrxC [Polyangiaceae bacterium]